MIESERFLYCGGEFKDEVFLSELKSCGIDTKIFKLSQIIKPQFISFGRGCQVDDFVWILGGQGVEAGDRVHISAYSSIVGGGKAILHSYSGLAAGCRIITGSEDFIGRSMTNPCVPLEFRRVQRSVVTIEKHALLFTNVIVLPGVNIGEGSVISAGSIVSSDVDPWGIYKMQNDKLERIRDRKKDKILEMEEKLKNQYSF